MTTKITGAIDLELTEFVVSNVLFGNTQPIIITENSLDRKSVHRLIEKDAINLIEKIDNNRYRVQLSSDMREIYESVKRYTTDDCDVILRHPDTTVPVNDENMPPKVRTIISLFNSR